MIIKEKILHKGAEASLYYGSWFKKTVIFKHHIPKKYRLEELDKTIRTTRTLNEAKALIRVKDYGLNVPQVYEIDAINSIIIMKFIEGEKLKNIMTQLDDDKKRNYFSLLGHNIAILHRNGHIHGDITTSNIISLQMRRFFL